MSAHRLRIVLARNAWDELSDVLQHSEETWGADQRSAYEHLIRDTFAILALTPGIGRTRDDLAKGLRSHPVGSHVLYYWNTDSALLIAHILHNRRDPGREHWSRSDDE
jgi:toxin ParE1/3/4